MVSECLRRWRVRQKVLNNHALRAWSTTTSLPAGLRTDQATNSNWPLPAEAIRKSRHKEEADNAANVESIVHKAKFRTSRMIEVLLPRFHQLRRVEQLTVITLYQRRGSAYAATEGKKGDEVRFGSVEILVCHPSRLNLSFAPSWTYQ